MKRAGTAKRTAGLLFMILCLVLLLLQTVYAAKNGSLKLSYAADGTRFDIYRAAEIGDAGQYVLTGSFENYQVELGEGSLLDAAVTLAGYVSADGLEPLKSGTTGNGSVTFDGLENGLYLIIGQRKTENGKIYTPVPFLTAVNGALVTSEVKADEEPEVPDQPHVYTYEITKVWKNDSDRVRPDSVTILILMDGAVKEEIALSPENGWSYTWTAEELHNWQAAEQDVPDRYTVAVSREWDKFTVTNTYHWPDDSDSDHEESEDRGTSGNASGTSDSQGGQEEALPSEIDVIANEDAELPLMVLPKTGQLWWPVLALAAAGGILLLAGIKMQRKNRENNEK